MYKIKNKAYGTVERYKACLVAKRYTRKECIDFLDNFSPISKLVTLKLLLSLVAIFSWSLTQPDVTNVFLHGDLNKEIYMSIPPGYSCQRGSTTRKKYMVTFIINHHKQKVSLQHSVTLSNDIVEGTNG